MIKVRSTVEEFDFQKFKEEYCKKHGIKSIDSLQVPSENSNEEIRSSFERDLRNSFENSDIQIVLLDGTIFDSLGNQTYDNDYDETLNGLLIGVRNPNQEDRRKQISTKRYFFPRKLRPLRQESIQFWVKDENHLSEILSKWSHLSFGLKLGNRSATEILSLIAYFNWKYGSLTKNLIGKKIFDIAEKRSKAHCYQGNWSRISKILQMQENPIALFGIYKELIPRRELKGNLLPIGEKLFNEKLCRLSCYPVNRPKRKRGYSDKGSRLDPSKDHKTEMTIVGEDVRVTREGLSLSSKEALVHFLYGVTNPCKKKPKKGILEIEYDKKIARDKKEILRREKQRERQYTSEVRTFFVDPKSKD